MANPADNDNLIKGIMAMTQDRKERDKLVSNALRSIPDHRQANALESIAMLLSVIATHLAGDDCASSRIIQNAMKHMQ